MHINDEIVDILREFRIPFEDGIVYLLAKHFRYKPSYFPPALEATMNRTGIFYMDENNSLEWKVPLFDDLVQEPWEWVKSEYWQMFKDANPDKKGNGNQCVRLMKALFAKRPDIRKEEVLGATRMYIANNDPKYIRRSNYFIKKGKGADLSEDILEWIDTFRESNVSANSRTTKMQ